jgi:hypothetical protein
MDLTTDSPKWVKISRARMPQSTSTVYIEIIGGAGYEVNSPYQAAMADIVLRTASGDPRGPECSYLSHNGFCRAERSHCEHR